jgi:hypothetical protein
VPGRDVRQAEVYRNVHLRLRRVLTTLRVLVLGAVVAACGGNAPEDRASRAQREPVAPERDGIEPVDEPGPVPEPVPGPAPVPPAPVVARAIKVRVMHLAALQAKAPLVVRLGAEPSTTAVTVGYAEVPQEGETTVSGPAVEMRWEGGEGRTHVLRGEERVTAFVVSRDPEEDVLAGLPVGAARHSASNGGLELGSAHDRVDAPAAGTIRVRFVNALLGERRIDVCMVPDGPEPVFPYVHYGVVDGMHQEDRPPEEVRWVEVPAAAPPRWEIRRGEFDAPCRGRSIGFFSVPRALDGQNVTLVLMGRVRGTPRRQLLACSDPPAASACVSVPLR